PAKATDQLDGDLADARLQELDVLGGEPILDEPPQPLVTGWVHVQELALGREELSDPLALLREEGPAGVRERPPAAERGPHVVVAGERPEVAVRHVVDGRPL